MDCHHYPVRELIPFREVPRLTKSETIDAAPRETVAFPANLNLSDGPVREKIDARLYSDAIARYSVLREFTGLLMAALHVS